MKSIKVYHYDAFSKEPNKGNPAGVVFNGEVLSEEEMQEIASKVGFNETAFPIKSNIADLRIRYFTPGFEMDLCGHATIATIIALKDYGVLGDKTVFKVETKAGVLPIRIDRDGVVTMQQVTPQFNEFKGSKEDLAHSIGLEKEDIDDSFPTLYGSTGTWTLLIPIKKIDAFRKMKPNNKVFSDILKENPKASIHPFCLETYDPYSDMHGRHFSSAYSGLAEDPVTGTASGVMGAYYAKYINSNFEKSLNLVIEQGQEIDKDGRVMVHVSRTKGNYDIAISGNAISVKDFEVKL